MKYLFIYKYQKSVKMSKDVTFLMITVMLKIDIYVKVLTYFMNVEQILWYYHHD